MRKTTLLLACLALLFPIIMSGCSDDDCATCYGTGMGFATGSIYLDPEAYLDYMYIYGYGAVPPNIDSAAIGDSTIGVDDIYYNYEEDYHDAYWEIYFSEDGDNYMYEHGDTAVMTVWGEGKSSTCRVVILDADSAEATITSPEYNADTVANDESVTTYWNTVPEADYYAIMLEFRNLVNGSSDWYYEFYYTLDTEFTVTPDHYPDSLYYFYVNVTPFTGPDPRTGKTNWTGDLLGGKLYSFGWDDYTRIYGWNYPIITGADKMVPGDDRPEWKPTDIVNAVYDKYK